MQVPQTVLDALGGKNVIVFDGVCVLCNGWVKFVLRFDRHQVFDFLVAQSELGEAVYADLGLKSDDYDTFIVIKDGQLWTKLDGVFTLFSAIGFPWRLLSVFRVLPKSLKDWIYDRVAKNRYSIFGRRDTCMMPSPEVQGRFL